MSRLMSGIAAVARQDQGAVLEPPVAVRSACTKILVRSMDWMLVSVSC